MILTYQGSNKTLAGDYIKIRHITKDESVTRAQLADLIGDLYSIDKCEPNRQQGEVVEPSQDDFIEQVESQLSTALCGIDDDGSYTAELHVIGYNYTLRLQGGMQLSSQYVETQITRIYNVEDVTGIDFEYLIIRGVTPNTFEWYGNTAGISFSPHGVVFDREVTGVLYVTFWTEYDLVKVHIPGVGQSPGICRSLAFNGSVFALDVEAPELKDVDPLTQLAICGNSATVTKDYDDIQCYNLITETVRCSCGGDISEIRTIEENTTCPDSGLSISNGRALVDTEERTVYESCEDSGNEDVSEPEFYEDVCCTGSESTLPPCRVTIQKNNGGAEVENGADYWLERYGADTVIVPVSPKDGDCGLIKTTINVNAKNCDEPIDCENPDPLLWDHDNGDVIDPPGSLNVCVIGGEGEKTWTVSGEGFSFGNGETTIIGGNCATVVAESNACGSASISVTDECDQSTGGSIRSTNGRWQLVYDSNGGYDHGKMTCGPGEENPPGSWSYEFISGKNKSIQNWYPAISQSWCESRTVYIPPCVIPPELTDSCYGACMSTAPCPCSGCTVKYVQREASYLWVC